MTFVRAVLVGGVVATAMVVAIRHLPVEEQKADAAISIEALRDVGLMRAAAGVPVPVEKPMVLPPLDEFPPKVEPPKPPMVDPPPKAYPPPTKVAQWRRLRRVAMDICAAHHFRRVQHGLSWHCVR